MSFCCRGSKIFVDIFYKLQLFNKIEFIKYIEYSIIMKDCLTLHFLKYFERLYAGEMDFFLGAPALQSKPIGRRIFARVYLL
jgi:hypothetical protein